MKITNLATCYDEHLGTLVYAVCTKEVLLNPEGVANLCPPRYKEEQAIFCYIQGRKGWERLPDIPDFTN